MKKKLAIILGIVFLIFIFNCCRTTNEKEVEVININPTTAQDEVRLSEFVEEVYVIQLQSSDVLGRIPYLEITGDRIFVSDASNRAIFVFDHDGQQLSKLQEIGRGPGEYSQIGPSYVSADGSRFNMYVRAGSSGFSHYVFNIEKNGFEYLEALEHDWIIANYVRKFGKYTYFFTSRLENIIDDQLTNSEIIIAKDGNIVGKLIPSLFESSGSGFSAHSLGFCQTPEGRIIATSAFSNSFYLVDGLEASPVITVGFSNYGIDNSKGTESIQQQMEYVSNAIGLASFPELRVFLPNFKYISYNFFDHSATSFYDRSIFRHFFQLNSGEIEINSKKIVNDITEFPPLVYGYFGSRTAFNAYLDGFLYDFILPKDLLPEGKTEGYIQGLGSISVNDNPIVVKMKLKQSLLSR